MKNNTSIRIRPILPADEPFLWDILYAAIHVPPGAEPPPRSVLNEPSLAHYVKDWGREGDLGWIAASTDETPCGAAWLRIWTPADHGFGYIAPKYPELTIAVLPGFRGRGIGTLLLSAIAESAIGRFPGISLSVSKGNPAQKLYERSGYRYYSEDRDSITMLRLFN
ncbi:MAG: GNAT family N-acetyltransferase [Anaerolineaceae bacterium]|nr:GNAT family N-acetyltransferase [Anaerolineaceae bacterium]